MSHTPAPLAENGNLSPAMRRALDLITERGHAVLDTQTNPALGTVHSGTARALQDRDLVRVWFRGHHSEAVLPGSERDRDVANVDSPPAP